MTRILLLTLLTFIFCTSTFAKVPELKPFKKGVNLEQLRPQEKNGKWGFADAKGKFVIKASFDKAIKYIHKLAVISIDNKYGLIGNDGTYLVHPQYDLITSLDRNANFMIKKDHNWGIIDAKGQITTEPILTEQPELLNNGIYKLCANGLYGLANSNGQITIEPILTE